MIRPDLGKYPITQVFGANPEYYGPGGHDGVDLGTPANTPLYAGVSGIVTSLVDDPVGGLFIQIKGNEYYVYTGHMNRSIVSVGQKVNEGQQIGLSGATGHVTGPHTHWRVKKLSGALVDPLTLPLNGGENMQQELEAAKNAAKINGDIAELRRQNFARTAEAANVVITGDEVKDTDRIVAEIKAAQNGAKQNGDIAELRRQNFQRICDAVGVTNDGNEVKITDEIVKQVAAGEYIPLSSNQLYVKR